MGLGLGAAAIASAGPALALDDGYEAMLMKCIDPRFTTDTWKYMSSRGWQKQDVPVHSIFRAPCSIAPASSSAFPA